MSMRVIKVQRLLLSVVLANVFWMVTDLAKSFLWRLDVTNFFFPLCATFVFFILLYDFNTNFYQIVHTKHQNLLTLSSYWCVCDIEIVEGSSVDKCHQ